MKVRTKEILNEIRDQIPGFYEKKTPIDSNCDYKRLWKLTEELRSEAYLIHMSEDELNSFISVAYKILTRIKFLNEGSEFSFLVIESILDSIWHQKKTEELSNKTRRELAKLAITIMNPTNDQYWIDSLAPSASSFNHCIYFIFMLEDRFRTENEEFEAVYNQLEKYIKRYGNDHHLSQRWIKRFENINNASC